MNALIDAALNRSRAFILILLIILISGLFTYISIPKEEYPDIQIPYIYVSISHEGISPEDAERLLVRPMEKELRGIDGVKEMKAVASEGFASVFMEFDAGFDSDKALLDVREKVDIAKSELPDATDEPIVNEVNFSLFPVVNIILTSDIEEKAFINIVNNLAAEVESLAEILEVDIAGDREEALDIIINPLMVESYGLTSQIIQLVDRNNRLVAAGALDSKSGRYSVKVPGLIENLQDLIKLPIKANQNSVVTLGDVADIRHSYKDRTGFARVNGKPALVLEVSKRTGENLIDSVAKVKAVVEHESKSWPEGIEVLYAQDKSSRIKTMVNELQNNILFAVILVMIVIILFIGVRSAFFISMAIPGAFLFGILIISAFGVTLNVVVLFALILSIGMLVDNAIVVVEYANRQMIEGESYKTAYGTAAKRMAWPIIASTVTTLTVFAPLLFWPGIMGQFMRYMPMTLIATLFASLTMALLFIPAIGRWIGKADKYDQKTKSNILNSESGDITKLTGLTGLYISILSKALSNPIKTILVIISAMVVIIMAYIQLSPGVEFFPKVEPQNASILIRARGNLSTIEKDNLSKEVENQISGMTDQIKIFYTRSGEVGGDKSKYPADIIAVIQLEYHDWDKRNKSFKILEEVKSRTQNIAGIIVETREQFGGPASGRDVEIEISSHNKNLLKPVTKKLLAAMNKISGFSDVSNSLPIPAIEWQMEVDRPQAAKFGVDIGTIGDFIKMVTNGLKTSSYRPDNNDDEVDIMVRYPKEYRGIGQLDSLRVTTNNGTIPVGSFVKRIAKQKISEINKVDTVEVTTISASVKKGLIADNKITEIKDWIKTANISPEVNIRFKGDDEKKKQTENFLKKAFLLSITAMGLILLLQFNSIYQTIIILSAVFLSIGGVFLGLLVTMKPFGIVMCGVGIIALAGIVVNNNIIFIDTFNHLKAKGMDQMEALLRTGAQRVRPILLTAGTTVLGLIPMITTMNIDFINRKVSVGAPSTQWWEQLSTAIAGGLTFATILTLFLTPCLLIIRKQKTKKEK